MHTHTHTRFAFGYLWVSLGHIPLSECESERAKSKNQRTYILLHTPGVMLLETHRAHRGLAAIRRLSFLRRNSAPMN
jgi:hypothetical protein